MRKVCLSFDFEECDLPREHGVEFPIEDGMKVSSEGAHAVLDVLERHGVKATFFCTLNFAERAPDVMKRIIAGGHEVAAHGLGHFRQDPKDPFLCKEGLERIYGVKVYGYRHPRMLPVDDALLAKAGYLYSSSLNPTFVPGRYMHLVTPRTVFEKNGLTQVPASVTPWMRFPLFWLALHLLPEWLYHVLAKRTLKHDGCLVTYFHPWEFSTLSERAVELKVPRLIRMNLGRPMVGRLDRLIAELKLPDVEFVTIRDLVKGGCAARNVSTAVSRTSHIIRSSFWTFFIATVLSSAIDKANSVVSGMIVGQSLGPDAVSVVNMAYPILNFIKIPSMFVVLGASLLAAKAVGGRKYEDVKRLFTVTLVFSVGLALVVALGVWGFGWEVAKSLTEEKRILPILGPFIGPAAFSCVSTVAYAAFSAFAKTVGKPRLVVRGAIADLVANLLLTVFFVRGLGMGMTGVALSLFLAGVVAVVSMGTIFRTDSRMIGIVRPTGGWFVPLAWRSFVLGAPLQIGALLLSIVVLLFNFLAEGIGGADGLFFISIGIQMMTVGILVLTGSSGAVVSVGGALWGEKDMLGYRILLKSVFRIVFVSQSALIALVWMFPEAISAAFGADAALAAKAVQPLGEMSLMFLPMCTVMVLVSVYTLEGHGRAAMVLQLGLFASLLAPLFLTARFLPSAFWLSIPVGTTVLLLLTTVWSVITSRRNGNLHWFTLAPKTDAFPECGFSLKASGIDIAVVQDEITDFLVGRSVATTTASDIRSDAGDILRRIGEGNDSARCDVRVVDVDEKGLREIRVIVKVAGPQYDPSDGIRLRAASVKYDFLNGINCVYLTYAVKRGALA